MIFPTGLSSGTGQSVNATVVTTPLTVAVMTPDAVQVSVTEALTITVDVTCNNNATIGGQ